MTDTHKRATQSYTSADALTHAGFSAFNVGVLIVTFFIQIAIVTFTLSTTIVSKLAQCDLHLTDMQTTALASVFYTGYMVGNTVFGIWTDRYGTRKMVLLSFFVLSVLVVVYCFLPWYSALLVCEFMYGFNIAASPIASVLCIELLPPSKRHYVQLPYLGIPLGTLYVCFIA